MSTVSYLINESYIDELRERIAQLIESASPSEISGMLVQGGYDIPPREHLAAIIDAAFWTSFATDEGNPVTVSIIMRRAEEGYDTFRFDKAIAFEVKNLVKLGAALENPRADIGVWPDETGKLTVWGFKVRNEDAIIPDLWVQALGPGRVLITYGSKSLGALTPNEAIFIDHANLVRAVLPKFTSGADAAEERMLRLLRYTSLLATARAMRLHGRGGTLLVVPDSLRWKTSIESSVPYTGGASFLESEFDVSKKPSLLAPVTDFFAALMRKKETKQRSELFQIRSQIAQQCRRIARLTAVDGALVMTYDRFVFCFGAKIIPAGGQQRPATLRAYRPVEGDTGTSISFTEVGGMRHQSAALFAHAHPDAVAIAVSQDGDISYFTTDGASGELLVIQQAELAVLHEGLGAALWNYNSVEKMGWL